VDGHETAELLPRLVCCTASHELADLDREPCVVRRLRRP
jgi:hypothetical protein